jgi:hypothetical protein
MVTMETQAFMLSVSSSFWARLERARMSAASITDRAWAWGSSDRLIGDP